MGLWSKYVNRRTVGANLSFQCPHPTKVFSDIRFLFQHLIRSSLSSLKWSRRYSFPLCTYRGCSTSYSSNHIFYLLWASIFTKFSAQEYFLKANSSSSKQEISHISWHKNGNNGVYKKCSIALNRNKMKHVYALPFFYSWGSTFLRSHLGLPSGFFYSIFFPTNPYTHTYIYIYIYSPMS